MKPEPKFVKGEQVAVRGVATSAYDTERTVITAVKYVSKAEARKTKRPAGWAYQTAHQPNPNYFFREASLRKLPGDSAADWADCIWRPNKATA